MKIFGKTPAEYWGAIKWYFLIILVITLVQLFLIFQEVYSPGKFDPVGVLKIIFVILAARTTVKKSDFNLKQTAAAGGFLLLASIQSTMPVLLKLALPNLISYLFVPVIVFSANLTLYVSIALVTGWLTKKFSKK